MVVPETGKVHYSRYKGDDTVIFVEMDLNTLTGTTMSVKYNPKTGAAYEAGYVGSPSLTPATCPP